MVRISIKQINIFILTITIITVFNSCSNVKTATVYGSNWNGFIRTPLAPPYQAPGNPPYTIKENIKFTGNFSEMKGDLSKNNLLIESPSLKIINDKPSSNESWKDIWYSYSDSDVQSDGSREVTLKGRCVLTNRKLNSIHPDGKLDFDLKLIVVPNKPYHFVINVLTTKEGTASDLQVSGNANAPNGSILFLPSK